MRLHGNRAYDDRQEELSRFFVRGSLIHRFGRSLEWWAVFGICISAALLWEIMVATFQKSFFPTDTNVFQELERDRVVRRRFEDAVEGNVGKGGGEERERVCRAVREAMEKASVPKKRIRRG